MRQRYLRPFACGLALLGLALLVLSGRAAVLANGTCPPTYYCVAPVNVTDSVNGQNVQLNWKLTSDTSTPYQQWVERGPSPYQLVPIQTFSSGAIQTSYTDQNVPPGTYYYAACNVYFNVDDGTLDPECALAEPEGVQVKASTSGGMGSGGMGSGNSGGGAPPPANPPPAGPQGCTPPVDPNQVLIFVAAGYSGACAAVPVAAFPTAESAGIPNDTLSSFQIGANVQLVICEDVNFGGGCSTYVDNDPNLAAPRAAQPRPINGPGMDNDHMSSLCVQWRGTPPGTPCGPATAPETDPTVSDRSQTTLTMTWTPGSSGTYQQISCDGPVFGAASNDCATVVSHDTTSYTFTGLQADHKYVLQVCNVEEYGEQSQDSLCSNLVTARTLPPAPTNITATNITRSGIDLHWDTNIGDPGSQVTYTITRDGTQVVAGLVPVRLPSAADSCPYLPFDPATGRPNAACDDNHAPISFTTSVTYTDSFAVGSGGYSYTVCAVDAQDDVVQACATAKIDTPIGLGPLNPNGVPIPGE